MRIHTHKPRSIHSHIYRAHVLQCIYLKICIYVNIFYTYYTSIYAYGHIHTHLSVCVCVYMCVCCVFWLLATCGTACLTLQVLVSLSLCLRLYLYLERKRAKLWSKFRVQTRQRFFKEDRDWRIKEVGRKLGCLRKKEEGSLGRSRWPEFLRSFCGGVRMCHYFPAFDSPL